MPTRGAWAEIVPLPHLTSVAIALRIVEGAADAPPVPGEYKLRVHVTSTSVIGIHCTMDAGFTVVEDDVPDLE